MKPLSETSVTIVGLGLMGGSLAVTLKAHVASIHAIDTDPKTLDRAINKGVIDSGAISMSGIQETTDLIIFATPVQTIIELINQLPEIFPDGCAFMDMGSTKTEIVRAMSALPAEFQALGGHPMCGREVSGFDAATHNLYQAKTFVLCPSERTTSALEERVYQILDVIGARPLLLTAQLHDTLVSVTSHLPYVLAALLMLQVSNAASGNEKLWFLTASGFRDTSRLAGSSVNMMTDILFTNRTNMVEQLAHYRIAIASLEEMLKNDDQSGVQVLLNEAYQAYSNYLDRRPAM